MTEETLDAAILTLRAKALEIYGVMKDIYARDKKIGDADLLAQNALKLAQFEGAMLTLQQYKGAIVESAKNKPPEPDPEPEQKVATEDDLAEKSETYRRSMKHHQAREIDES
jgi:hypothetical protein